jgi:hypothetical protein
MMDQVNREYRLCHVFEMLLQRYSAHVLVRFFAVGNTTMIKFCYSKFVFIECMRTCEKFILHLLNIILLTDSYFYYVV